jgi:GWxTD domain-containing protein
VTTRYGLRGARRRAPILRRLLACALGFLVGSPALDARTNYKKWLDEEVVWIVSQKEREAFRQLRTDVERDDFIQRFWERRDPTPDTPRNEYKEEHYRRFEHALKTFQEGIPGWKSDRGRIYIIHGPPDKESFQPSDSRLNLDGRGDKRGRTPNTIIWAYHEVRNGKYYKGELNLIFQPTMGLSRQSFALSDSKTAQDKADEMSKRFGPAADQTWLESDVRFQLIVAGPPALMNARGQEIPTAGIGDAARYIEDLTRSPGELLEERDARALEARKVQDQMRQAVSTRMSFGSVPLGLQSRSFLQPDGKYRVAVELAIPRSELANARKSGGTQATRLDVYCALVNAAGTVADEFIDSVDLPSDLASIDRELRYRNAFTTDPGQFRLKAAIQTSELERLGYGEEAVLLMPPQGAELAATGLLVTDRVEPVTPENRRPERGFVFGQTRLVPSATVHFARSGQMFVYLQLLLPRDRTIEQCELSVAMSFIADGAVVRKVEPRRIGESQSQLPGVVNFATGIPLANFTPGAYQVQVQAIDHVSKQFVVKRALFYID